MAAAPAELAVRGLTKSFPGTQALADFTFDVRAGEIHAVVGENGAGKTTLLMILSGVYAPDRGRVLVGGEEVSFTRPSDAIAAGIGTVFQELSLVDGLTVAENVFANRAPTRGPGLIDRPRMERETRELLGLLDSDLRPTRRVASLGVGDRQVVEIAKALSLNARILLLDEPTSSRSSAACGSRGWRSSLFRTGWRRCSRSPTGPQSSATGVTWRHTCARRSTATRSFARWSAASCPTSTPSGRRSRGRRCSSCGACAVERSGRSTSSCGRARSSGSRGCAAQDVRGSGGWCSAPNRSRRENCA